MVNSNTFWLPTLFSHDDEALKNLFFNSFMWNAKSCDINCAHNEYFPSKIILHNLCLIILSNKTILQDIKRL